MVPSDPSPFVLSPSTLSIHKAACVASTMVHAFRRWVAGDPELSHWCLMNHILWEADCHAERYTASSLFSQRDPWLPADP